MMKREHLVSGKGIQRKVKEIAIYRDPEKLKLILNKLTWKILLEISDKEMYPLEIARRLGIHEQKVYYHIRKLFEAEAIMKVREEDKKGATAKFYAPASNAFGIELPSSGRIQAVPLPPIDNRVGAFLRPIVDLGRFHGRIVVGSPTPHGPFKTSSRDGHYASHLAFFLGQYSLVPEEFVVKLDVDVKAEKEERNNMILVGGPGTNLITQEINDSLPIRFHMARSKHGFLLGGLVSERTNNVYTGDNIGLIAKIANPWNPEKRIILFAGNKAVGTKACVIAFTKCWKKLFQNYQEEDDFATVIQGFDLDGDGKVDSIEVLE